MKRALQIRILCLMLVTSSVLAAQQNRAEPANASSTAAPWTFSLTVDGYLIPHEQGYANPVLTADHKSLHLEARYNYENLRTGSLWLGYNFSAGKNVEFAVTPMIGGVFGRSTGIAPGFAASITYRKLELSISNEYVFDTRTKSGNFYYAWPQVTYSPLDWLKVGFAAQHLKAFQTPLDTQRGFLVGVSHHKLEFTTYVFNAGWTDPTVVLEAGYKF